MASTPSPCRTPPLVVSNAAARSILLVRDVLLSGDALHSTLEPCAAEPLAKIFFRTGAYRRARTE